jgi:hypothetical protein
MVVLDLMELAVLTLEEEEVEQEQLEEMLLCLLVDQVE